MWGWWSSSVKVAPPYLKVTSISSSSTNVMASNLGQLIETYHAQTVVTYKLRTTGLIVERVMGIEPTLSAWEAGVLPLNYTRGALNVIAPAGIIQSTAQLNCH